MSSWSCHQCVKCHNSLARHSRPYLVYVLLGRVETCSNTCLHLDNGSTRTQARATELLYSMRAAPAPTPSVEPSPPTEMSTGGRIWEQVARACKAYICSHCVVVHVSHIHHGDWRDCVHVSRRSLLPQFACHESVKAHDKGGQSTLISYLTCNLNTRAWRNWQAACAPYTQSLMQIPDHNNASQLKCTISEVTIPCAQGRSGTHWQSPHPASHDCQWPHTPVVPGCSQT